MRQQLGQADPPEWMVKLLTDLTYAGDVEATESENEAMFSLALDAALKGVDISKRYPTFFRQLLSDRQARRDFLDALEMLQKSETGDPQMLPDSLDSELRFLEQRSLTRPGIELSGPAQWQVTWQRAQAYLQSLFASYFTAPGYRESSSLLEDAHLVLIDDSVTVDDIALNVQLGATRPAESPHSLSPSLFVSADVDLPLKATLVWGAYEESIPVENNRPVSFPLLSLEAITTEDEPDDVAHLQLSLQITTE